MRTLPLRRRGGTKAARAVRPELVALEAREVLSTTPQQQYALELTNRMRADPAAELAIARSLPSVQREMARAGTDQALLEAQWAALSPAAPLAWSDALAGTAGGHSQLMNATGQFGHNLPGEPAFRDRLIGAGYTAGGENLYYGENNLAVAHALLAVDPMPGGPGGLFPNVGHRANLMNPAFKELGVGLAYQGGTGAAFLTD